ncbi:MAG: thioredoxin-dependent thiol peroxidase [Gemmatimonadota bacterium]|nr:thioredoxin-dependent thiol peroxidase [Gemmatimonadota bacterium]
MAEIERGSVAPGFTLEADDGTSVSLVELRGKKVVLYFYPRDDTPGCSMQACDLRDNMLRLAKAGVIALGVSPDSVQSHAKFKDKYQLNFPLLADQDHRVAQAYGVWQEKMNFGVKSLGIVRSTFLIDEEGIVTDVWRRVRARDHIRWVGERLDI